MLSQARLSIVEVGDRGWEPGSNGVWEPMGDGRRGDWWVTGIPQGAGAMKNQREKCNVIQ